MAKEPKSALQPQPQTQAQQPEPQQQQRIIMRNQRQVRMDLYKLELEKFQKNISWVKKQPELRAVEHVHFWRSHNEHGQPNRFCNAVGGHYHEMKPLYENGKPLLDENGDHVVECGPPLRKVVKVVNGKAKTFNEPVAFDTQNSETGEIYKLKDDHRHVVRYDSSEYMSVETKKAIQAANSAAIGPVQFKPASTQVNTSGETVSFSNQEVEMTEI